MSRGTEGFGLPSGKRTRSAGWTPTTGKIEEFQTPGVDVPRRMGADWEGNIWVGFHETGKLVKIDQKYRQDDLLRPLRPRTMAPISRSPMQGAR